MLSIQFLSMKCLSVHTKSKQKQQCDAKQFNRNEKIYLGN